MKFTISGVTISAAQIRSPSFSRSSSSATTTNLPAAKVGQRTCDRIGSVNGHVGSGHQVSEVRHRSAVRDSAARFAARCGAARRATCFASTSASMCTRIAGSKRAERGVPARVFDDGELHAVVEQQSLTVRLTPSTVSEPCGAMSGASSGGSCQVDEPGVVPRGSVSHDGDRHRHGRAPCAHRADRRGALRARG